jgi:RNA polymerase sigma factor (sigma-70 family)
MPPPNDLLELMDRARAGDQEAARIIVEQFRKPVKKVIRYRLQPKARRLYDSDDLLQNIWVAFFEKALDLTFSCPQQVTVYLQKLAENKVREAHRQELGTKKWQHDQVRLTPTLCEDPAPGPDRLAEAEDEWRWLLVLMPCDRDWHHAFYLSRRGHTHAEIALELGVSERTIDRLFERARDAYAETRNQGPPLDHRN